MSHYWAISHAMFILLPEQENTVLQWTFKLNSALAAAKNWHLKRLYAEG